MRIVGLFFAACYAILLLDWCRCVVALSRRDVQLDETTPHNVAGQPHHAQERPKVDRQARNLHHAEGMAALPSCCYLDCPSGSQYNYGRQLLGAKKDKRSLHHSMINSQNNNCAYNCDACGANCCSCIQVSAARRSAVEMQCTCTPGCDHHHHFAHHYHTGMSDPHHHHHSSS